jgi:hypothetical protein
VWDVCVNILLTRSDVVIRPRRVLCSPGSLQDRIPRRVDYAIEEQGGVWESDAMME